MIRPLPPAETGRIAVEPPATAPRIRVSRIVLAAVIVTAVAFGVFFRLFHVDGKVYWEDETYTSLHVLGVTEAQVVAGAARLSNAADLRAILHPQPPLRTGIGDTVHALALEDPQHPPGYYVLGHLWVKMFGDSVTALRMLSVVMGLAMLPCVYWLCIELFGSVLAAWIGVALMASSPVAVLFSQEAREYIAWMLATVVMGALFMRALRVGSARDWALYACAVAANLYIFPLAAPLVCANVVTAAVVLGRRPRRLIAPILASLAGIVAFAPWAAVLYASAHKVDRAMGLTAVVRATKLEGLRHIVALLKLDLLDVNAREPHAVGALVSLIALGSIALAFRTLVRRAPRRTSAFIVGTALFSALPLFALDLVLGQRSSENPRYFMPLFVSLDLAFAFAIATALRSATRATASGRAVAVTACALLVAARLASCAASAAAPTWWNKFDEQSIAVAAVINAAKNPVIASNEYMERPLSLANYLDARVAVVLRPQCYLCSTPNGEPFDFRDAAAALPPGQTLTTFVLGSAGNVPAAASATPGEPVRCIDDRFNAEQRCAGAALRLWPRP